MTKQERMDIKQLKWIGEAVIFLATEQYKRGDICKTPFKQLEECLKVVKFALPKIHKEEMAKKAKRKR